jgi:hypothetical protein
MLVFVLSLVMWAGTFSATPPLASGWITFFPNSTVAFDVYSFYNGTLVRTEFSGNVTIVYAYYDPWLRRWFVECSVFGVGRRNGGSPQIATGTVSLRSYPANVRWTTFIWYGTITVSSMWQSPGWVVSFPFEPD